MEILKYIKSIITIFFCFLIYINCFSQSAIKTQISGLDSLVRDIPALDERVTVSVSNVSVYEFLRGIANSSGLNVNVDPGINSMVANNFENVRVADILQFLADEYQLDISIIGNIINVRRTVKVNNVPVAKNILYDSIYDLVTLNYQNKSLPAATKEITENTGKNIILSPGLEGNTVSGYVQDMPFDNALRRFAFANNLTVEKSEDNFYILSKQNVETDQTVPQRVQTRTIEPVRAGTYELEANVISYDSIMVYARNAPTDILIKEVTDKLGLSYYFSTPMSGTTTLTVSGIDYDEFLSLVLYGTQYYYVRRNNVFIFTGTASSDLSDYRVVKLRYRSVSKLLELFPESVKKGVELEELVELNSILVGGSSDKVNGVTDFIGQIDKPVPVILIEVTIVYMDDSFTIETGIASGIGEETIETAGSIYPELDINIGADALNKILSGIDGFNSINLGKVSPNFYLSLKALESQGLVDITSTPKLSTMNGHEATMSIGNTEYYVEKSTTVFGTQDPQLLSSESYKSIDAELSITITPSVSGDDQITLDIEVIQSDFTPRISEYAPPGKTTRKFKSMIRVKDQETILLGGLEEHEKSETAKGVPLLSRIPVLKWLFSGRSKVNQKTRLNVFIKPTIIN